MSAIVNIENIYGLPPLVREVAHAPARRSGMFAPQRDTIEFSSIGRELARAVEQSSLRIARTRAIRAEIESGTFETPERINGTAQRLLDVIG